MSLLPSTRITDAPFSMAIMAAGSPAAPDPITTTSASLSHLCAAGAACAACAAGARAARAAPFRNALRSRFFFGIGFPMMFCLLRGSIRPHPHPHHFRNLTYRGPVGMSSEEHEAGISLFSPKSPKLYRSLGRLQGQKNACVENAGVCGGGAWWRPSRRGKPN